MSKIFKKYHTRKLTAEFNDYLLHQLNVDRMTLHERSLAKQQELLEAYQKAQAAYDRAKRLVDLKKRKSVPREIGKALTEAKNAYEGYQVLENKPVFGENATRAAAVTAEESRKIIEKYEAEHPEFKESVAELPRKAACADMTVGQLKKYLANFSRAKTYSRKDALGVVEKIDAGKALSESTRNDIADGKKPRQVLFPAEAFFRSDY